MSDGPLGSKMDGERLTMRAMDGAGACGEPRGHEWRLGE